MMNYLKVILLCIAVLSGLAKSQAYELDQMPLMSSLELLHSNMSYATTRPPTPIEPSCLSYYSYLAKLGSLFTQCVVSFSRPFRVCENCLKYYMQIQDAKDLIKNDVDVYATSLYKKGLKCQDIVDATDKVQTIVKIFTTIDTIWTAANCEDCFSSTYNRNATFNYTVKRGYDEFYAKHESLEFCIFNYTHNPISLDPIFESYKENCTLCNTCKDHYVNLTEHYNSLGHEKTLCMDVVDLFNYTRITWSKGYKCNYRDIDELPVVIISSTAILASILFYVSVRVCSKKKNHKFMKKSRIRT